MWSRQSVGLACAAALGSVCLALGGCDAAIGGDTTRPHGGGSSQNSGGSSQNSGGSSQNSGGSGGGSVVLPDGTVATLLPARVRRLTNSEYDFTVARLLGTSQAPGKEFAADARQAGYTPNHNQRVDPVLADQLQTAAQALAAEAVSQRLDALVPCAADARDEACAALFIASFGRKAYRRPLTDREIAALTDVYRAGAEGASFSDGIELVIAAVLQSPGFLYVTELGDSVPGSSGTTTLTPHEVAASIAYVVSGAPPDEELLSAADRGELATPEQRGAQVQRLLGVYETRYQFQRFVREWLGIDLLDKIAKSELASPGRDFNLLRSSMQAETNAFIDEVMSHDGASLNRLLTAEYTTPDDKMAQFYGLSAVTAPGAPRVAYGSAPRRGILTHASFLAAHSHELETGPVFRGVAVLRRVLCMVMPRPTALNIEIVPPPPDPTLTTRERFSAHSQNPDCAQCHNIIDPVGWAFEHYDALGGYREMENGKPIDSTGALLVDSDADGPFANVLELSQRLGQSQLARECYARQMYRFASAQNDQGAEDSFIKFWQQEPDSVRDNLIALVRAYVESELFVKRSVQ